MSLIQTLKRQVASKMQYFQKKHDRNEITPFVQQEIEFVNNVVELMNTEAQVIDNLKLEINYANYVISEMIRDLEQLDKESIFLNKLILEAISPLRKIKKQTFINFCNQNDEYIKIYTTGFQNYTRKSFIDQYFRYGRNDRREAISFNKNW